MKDVPECFEFGDLWLRVLGHWFSVLVRLSRCDHVQNGIWILGLFIRILGFGV